MSRRNTERASKKEQDEKEDIGWREGKKMKKDREQEG